MNNIKEGIDLGNKENKKPNEEDLKEEFKIIQNNISNWIRNSLYIKNWGISIWALMTVLILSQYYSHNNDINYAYLLLIPVFIPFPFWFFDSLFKKFERIAIARCNTIQDYLAGSLQKIDKGTRKEYRKLIKKEKYYKKIQKKLKNKDNREKLNKKCINQIEKSLKHNGKKYENQFPSYDPVGRISCKNSFFKVKYFRFTNTWRCIFVRIVSMIYLMLIIISLIIFSVIYCILIHLHLLITFPLELNLRWDCILCLSGIFSAINLVIGLILIWIKCEKWKI